MEDNCFKNDNDPESIPFPIFLKIFLTLISCDFNLLFIIFLLGILSHQVIYGIGMNLS
jgi:hypothetical protein